MLAGVSADRLCAVLNHLEVETRLQRAKALEIARVPEQVDWHEVADRRIARTRMPSTIQVNQATLVDVDEYRPAAGTEDGKGCREGAERSGEHFLSRVEPQRAERDFNRIQAARAAHRESSAEAGCQGLLKLGDFRTENIPTAFAHLPHGLEDRRSGVGPLAREVIQTNRCGAHGLKLCRSAPWCERRRLHATAFLLGGCHTRASLQR